MEGIEHKGEGIREEIHVQTEEKNSFKNKIKENPWLLASLILGIIVIVLLVLNFSGMTGNVVSEDDAGQKIIDFAESRGINASVVEVNDQGSLYEVVLSIQGQEAPVYVTKDGGFMVQAPISLTGQATQTTQSTQPEEIPKTDKPKVELYVMGFCPYGNKAEDTMLPVYNLLKSKVEWSVHYIVSVSGTTVSSLHGQPEVDEDEREACVLKNNGLDKWWAFITYVNTNCGSDGSCWKDAAKQAGIQDTSISSCVSSNGLALMKAEAEAADAAGASGSPTLIINGVESTAVYQYGNSEAYKTAICSAFTTSPAECSQVLGTATSTSSTGGSC